MVWVIQQTRGSYPTEIFSLCSDGSGSQPVWTYLQRSRPKYGCHSPLEERAQPFDLGLYKAPEVKKVTFEKPGRVDVFCSIHSRMSCIVLVLENPYFASTNERGIYKIPNIPAGTYKLKAWHERLPSQTKEITISDDGTLKVDFTLGITNLPKY